jgi:malate dehydrogenase (oxaloacetate-decarboxylating)
MWRRTGWRRSGGPNQENNSYCFPGCFRGMLDVRAKLFNDQMELAAAHAPASIVAKGGLSEGYITPSMFDACVLPTAAGSECVL